MKTNTEEMAQYLNKYMTERLSMELVPKNVDNI